MNNFSDTNLNSYIFSEEKYNIINYNLYFLLLIFFFLLLILFYNDKQNIGVQKYLYKIYNNNIELKKKYINIINKDFNKIKLDNDVIILENLLTHEYHEYLKNQFQNKIFESKNAIFRKGSGINFLDLHKSEEFKGFLELYYSNELLDILKNIINKNIQRTPLSDNNSCSLLIYNNVGDHIDWHKDYSNYYGDRYVVLLSIINNNQNKICCSENEFMYMAKNDLNKIQLKPNNLMIFKGSEILHKSTSIGLGEQRILLSMTFCDICQEKKNVSYTIYENIKNLILYK